MTATNTANASLNCPVIGAGQAGSPSGREVAESDAAIRATGYRDETDRVAIAGAKDAPGAIVELPSRPPSQT